MEKNAKMFAKSTNLNEPSSKYDQIEEMSEFSKSDDCSSEKSYFEL